MRFRIHTCRGFGWDNAEEVLERYPELKNKIYILEGQLYMDINTTELSSWSYSVEDSIWIYDGYIE